VDVSPEGDRSEVKVGFAPRGGLGTSVYPVNGFIYAGGAPHDLDENFKPSLDLDLSDLIAESKNETPDAG
ncbi:hypothetical protein, partial [Escherichia coli]|uniref:hypothetical protein n=1 Tax=Escherichia coli TaxID=562 RepID=UPI00179E0B25|nr:hypothetical protein [Escherichia coli]